MQAQVESEQRELERLRRGQAPGEGSSKTRHEGFVARRPLATTFHDLVHFGALWCGCCTRTLTIEHPQPSEASGRSIIHNICI